MATQGRAGDCRILFLTWDLDVGGMQNHWRQMLASLRSEGVPVKLVCLGGRGYAATELLNEGIEVVCLEAGHNRWPLKLPALWRIARAFAPSVIVTASDTGIMVGAPLARLLGSSNIVNWHGPPGQYVGSRIALAHFVAARLGAGVISVSPSQEEELLRWGYPAECIRVIPNGINEPRAARSNRAGLREELGVASDVPLAVLVGRLDPEKRIDRFLEAVKIAQTSVPNLTAVVVGAGRLESDLRGLAARLSVPVQFAGFDSRPDRWIRAADVVCLTSQFEAFPLVLIEGMACSRPFVAMQSGGISSLARESGAGISVRPGATGDFAASLARLISDSSLAASMGAKGRCSWEQEMTLERMVQQYLECFADAQWKPIRS